MKETSDGVVSTGGDDLRSVGDHRLCDNHLSASKAAIQPVPAAVIA
ncbi:hypothetical protein [Anabaena sp. UHCC 0399]